MSKRLVDFGVDRAVEAVAAAKANGCEPHDVLLVVDFAKQQGYGPGAVVERLKIALPSMPVGRGWPNTESPSAKAQRADDRAEKRRREALESEATALIIACRRRGITGDDEIKAELEKVGLAWPR